MPSVTVQKAAPKPPIESVTVTLDETEALIVDLGLGSLTPAHFERALRGMEGYKLNRLHQLIAPLVTEGDLAESRTIARINSRIWSALHEVTKDV